MPGQSTDYQPSFPLTERAWSKSLSATWSQSGSPHGGTIGRFAVWGKGVIGGSHVKWTSWGFLAIIGSLAFLALYLKDREIKAGVDRLYRMIPDFAAIAYSISR